MSARIYDGRRFYPLDRDLPRSRDFASFDTEDDTQGKVLLVTFFDGERAVYYRRVDSALEFLYNLAPKRSLYLVAHNLEYDLVNLFRGRERCVEWRFFGDKLMSAKLLGTRIIFWDSLNHSYHSPLSKLGQVVGLPKLESSYGWTRGRKLTKRDIRYGIRDTEIVWHYMTQQQNFYRSVGAEMKTTTPGCALDYWRRRFQPWPIAALSDPVRRYIKQAYFGGRVEIFRMAARGSIGYYDINSLYPTVMRQKYPDINNLQSAGRHGVVEATVEVPYMHIPPLPVRMNGKLVFPVGVFRGLWCSCELNYARSVGVRVLKVHQRIGSPSTVLPFRAYVEDCYRKRMEATTPLENINFKFLMNSLYGKFGTDGYAQKLVDPGQVSSRELDGTEFMVGPLVCVTVRNEPPPYANILWAAWTTALARIELHKALVKLDAAGLAPLYCDTDSVFYQGKACPLDVGPGLGQWKQEANVRRFEAKAPKVYSYWTRGGREVKAKGVPHEAKVAFFDELRASYRKPIRMREAAARGLVPNVWTRVEKVLKSEYDKRKIVKGGETQPLSIYPARTVPGCGCISTRQGTT